MKKLILYLCIFLLLTGCQNSEKNTLETFSKTTVSSGFDTFLIIQTTAESQEEFDTNFNKAVSSFENMHQLFDIYNLYPEKNNLKLINDQAGVAPVKVDQEILDLLLLSRYFYDLSDGEFDITLGAVLQVWHSYRELNDGSIPSLEELEDASLCTGWDYVEIDEEEKTVFITNPCVSLDVGGIAKGFAVEKMAEILIQEDITMGIINAGGNNRTINSKLDGSLWRAEIQNPSGTPGAIVVSVEGSSSIVTSGDYQRFFIGEDGQRYHHIIDPQTYFPATYFHSVTVITENSAIADAFSTLLFTVPYEKGLEIIERYNQSHLEDPISAVWIIDNTEDPFSENYIEFSNYFGIFTEDLIGQIEVK